MLGIAQVWFTADLGAKFDTYWNVWFLRAFCFVGKLDQSIYVLLYI